MRLHAHRFDGIVVTLFINLLLGSLASSEPSLPPPIIEVPPGAYHLAEISFTLPTSAQRPQPLPVQAWISFRNGVGVAEHVLGPKSVVSPLDFQSGGPISTWAVDGLRLADGRITGKLRVQVTHTAPVSTLPVDLAFTSAGQVSGTIDSAPVTGILRDAAALDRDNGFAPGKDWRTFYGSRGGFQPVDSDRALIDDPTKPRLVWMSEERVGAGVKCNDDPIHAWTGSWSPILGDGRLFYLIHDPCGDITDQNERKRLGELAAKGKLSASVDPWCQGLDRRLDHRSLVDADDLAVAIDAASGRTLWRTRLQGRGMSPARYNGSSNGHRDHDIGRVGCYADGRVFLMGRTGRIYALNAATGTLVWEAPLPSLTPRLEAKRDAARAEKRLAYPDHYPSLFLAGPVVLCQDSAFDRRTGAIVWSLPYRFIGELQLPERELALGLGGQPSELVAADPVTGKVVWKAHLDGGPDLRTEALRLVQDIVITASGGKDRETQTTSGWRLSATGANRLWIVTHPGLKMGLTNLAPNGDQILIRYFHWDPPALAGLQQTRSIDAATGEVKAGFEKGLWTNTAQIARMNNLVFNQSNEITGYDRPWHSTALDIYRADRLTFVGRWDPPHCQTSNFDLLPMLWLPVDGRIIMRGRSRFFCYDFRVPK